MAVKLTESALRKIIMQELREMMGDGPMNPRGLAMTPEEEVLSAITSKPGGDAFLKRMRDAVRAQKGLDRTDPDAVRAWLESAVAADGSMKESKESERAAAGFLKDKLANARWRQESGWQGAALAVGAGALGSMLSAWAAKTGTPLDSFLDSMSMIIPVISAGTAGLEALDAVHAGREASSIKGVLSRVGKPTVKPPVVPGKLRETFPGRAYDRWKTTRPDEDDSESVPEWIVGMLAKDAEQEHGRKPFTSEEELADWLYSKTPGAYDLDAADFDEAAREIWMTTLGEA